MDDERRNARRRLRRRLLVWAVGLVGAVVVLCVVAGGAAYLAFDRPRPEGRPGPDADALAREVQGAVGVAAFRELGAVHFVFGGRRSHLWDRERHFDLVTTGDQRVYLRLGPKTGRVFEGDREVTDPEARREALDGAYRAWANDTFWLNPFPKLFDPGTRRALVDVADEAPERRGLLLTFSEGGVTPGDAYLFYVGADGRPDAWRMWVQILPIGGLRASWEDWVTLPGGAQVATSHAGLGPVTLELTEVWGGARPGALVPGDGDPFAPLAAP